MANPNGLPKDFKTALLVLYIFIFIFGTLNVVLMSCMLQSQRHLSFTKVSVINLISVHSFFLLTVPFRIYYYASDINWTIGSDLCRFVSLMIHAHMYLAFIFYVSLLIVRYVEHSNQRHKLEFHRTLHATIASATVWLIIFGSVFPAFSNFGDKHTDTTPCFHFSKALDDHRAKTFNYILSTLVILVWSVLAFFQVYFLIYVSKTFGKAACQRQEFWAQLKNVFFLSVMFFSFVPYQGFRVYYVSVYDNTTGIPNTTEIPNTKGIRNTEEIHHINEVFLAVTAFSCFDMIVFAGRDVCKLINSRGWFNCL
ncbi:probable G-protein coupled receptor 141 [Carassius gibelio]|uniref:probable G-protein coupled receptor 141 n=1 Tax=Carassius gibelio TaxID=101364 RepID=UPI00227864F5|nr:probable G-protein coupled receptor 141 [Carassius gibelio]XP_052403972.1 probable G-protein coupled receptor 141 [Carassius gibelio]XP_052403973.1 probable G-protein coupled receptor 141 [Carassius gibelio]